MGFPVSAPVIESISDVATLLHLVNEVPRTECVNHSGGGIKHLPLIRPDSLQEADDLLPIGVFELFRSDSVGQAVYQLRIGFRLVNVPGLGLSAGLRRCSELARQFIVRVDLN